MKIIEEPPVSKQLNETRNFDATRIFPSVQNWILLLLILFNLVALFYYLFYAYKYQFHSDAAATNLLAQEIYQTGHYFPSDWNYVNGDLWVVMMQTWVVLLMPFFKNGYALHATGAVIGCVLTGIATWGVCGILGMSQRTKLFAVALLSSGLTPAMSEHVYGQQAYGTIYYTASFLLLSAWKFIHSSGRARWTWGMFSALLFILLAWGNPQRALIYSVLPLLCGLAVAYRTISSDSTTSGTRRRPFGSLLLIALLGTLVGSLLYRHTMASNLSSMSTLTINWLDFPAMMSNVAQVLNGLLVVIGGVPAAGTAVTTLDGIVSALRMLAGAAVIVTAPFALSRCMRSGHSGRAFVAAAATASIACSLFIVLATSLSADGAAAQRARYLVPGLLLALLVIVAYVAHYKDMRADRRFAAAAALGILALSAPIAFELLNIPSRHAGSEERDISNLRLIHFLKSQGLQYGYSSFWHANQTTVLSDDVVKVRQIELSAGLPVPQRHLSSNRWYEISAWKGQSFLMLTNEEAKALNKAALFEQTGAPIRQLQFEEYQLFVFDHNMALDFPNWAVHVTAPLRYQVTLGTAHAIGHFDTSDHSLTSEKGEAGALRFGPYQRLTAGHYLVTFTLYIDGAPSGAFGSVDVVDGGQVFGAHPIDHRGRQQITIPVAIDKAAKAIEFRVFSSGEGTIKLFNVELTTDGLH